MEILRCRIRIFITKEKKKKRKKEKNANFKIILSSHTDFSLAKIQISVARFKISLKIGQIRWKHSAENYLYK